MTKPRPLIDRIEQFLEIERSIYGEFSVPEYSEPELSTSADRAHGELQTQPAEPTPIAGCSTLDELRSLCEQTDTLRTDLADTRLVFGSGNPQADLMVIGEAPGEQEDREGVPFVGAAGQLLTKILAAIKFDRDEVYITNILKHRPPNNRNPKPEEIAASLPYLERQIELIAPKIILGLGRIAGSALLGEEIPLKQMRGHVHQFHNIELMITYHPAALLRNQQWKRPAWEDVQAVRQRFDELTAGRES
ncbi:MAG: uracil-DNA glycosylase [Balneolaceae bacterium]